MKKLSIHAKLSPIMKDLTPLLRSLGLLDSEIKTYIATFQHGAGTVLDLTKLTKLSRQATYVAIESLIKRGLMSSVLHGKKRLYAAEHPSKLLAYAKRRESEVQERMHDLERAIPELELQMGGERPVVKLFEGKEGIRAIIQDLEMSPSKNPVELTDMVAMRKVLTPDDTKGVRSGMKKVNAHLKGLYAAEHHGAEFSGEPVPGEHIYLPKEFGDFKSNIGIYGDKIAMVTFEGKMHAILIEDKALVKAMRVLFDLAFKTGKDLSQKS